MRSIEEFINDASELSQQQKVFLIEALLEDLKNTNQDLDSVWKIEAENRVDDITYNKVKMIEGESVFREIKNKYEK